MRIFVLKRSWALTDVTWVTGWRSHYQPSLSIGHASRCPVLGLRLHSFCVGLHKRGVLPQKNSTESCSPWKCYKATRRVTLPTKWLLFEYLVPERVGRTVGTGSTSRVLIRTQTRLKSMIGFFCVSTQGDFGRSSTIGASHEITYKIWFLTFLSACGFE
jgi:hypothetical protein